MPSEIRSIGPTIRRLAKGTIDLVCWSAPVQLLKYATRTVWFKNVNTGYPVGVASPREVCATLRGLGDETVRDPETEGRRACCVPPADTDGLSYDALGSLGPRGLLHYEGCDGVAGRADRGARGELAVGGGALGGA